MTENCVKFFVFALFLVYNCKTIFLSFCDLDHVLLSKASNEKGAKDIQQNLATLASFFNTAVLILIACADSFLLLVSTVNCFPKIVWL